MSAFTDSTVASDNNDKGDKNALTALSVPSGLNVNNRPHRKEFSLESYDEAANESSDLEEIACMETINEIPHLNELTSDICNATTGESTCQNDLIAATYEGPINEMAHPSILKRTSAFTNQLPELSMMKSTSAITNPAVVPSMLKRTSAFADPSPGISMLTSTSALTNPVIVPSMLKRTSALTNPSTAPSMLKSSSGITNLSAVACKVKSVSWRGLSSATICPCDLVTEHGETTNERIIPFGWKKAASDGITNTSISTSTLVTKTQEGSTSETSSEQFSKFDDDDDDEFSDLHKPYHKKIVDLIVSSFAFRIFGILLIFVDVYLVVSDLIFAESKTYISLAYRSTSLAIALFFVMDVLLQIYVVGKQHYFSDMFNIIDAIVIVVTLAFEIIYMFYDFRLHSGIPRFTILFRPLRLIILVRMFHLAHQKRELERLTRRLVSGNKRRFTKDGFDLDLTYITERIIAMSFPSSGKQSFYRNPIQEVARFLDMKHGNHYQVYNLCSMYMTQYFAAIDRKKITACERTYNPKYFHDRIRRIMIDDHNVPTLQDMVTFSKEADAWMAQDKNNIIVIHCKGGKGRTGTMVCTYLLASEKFLTAEESLCFFGQRRTDKTRSAKFQGVETPSQSRYVRYFEKVKSDYKWELPPRQILNINKFIIYSIHGVGKGNGTDLKICIIMQQKIIFSSCSNNCRVFHDIESDRVIFIIYNCPAVYDDVKVQFFSSKLPKYYDNCCFFFWFNTSFIQNNRLFLRRNELDNPHKPKTWKIYRREFAVEVYFNEIS